MAMAVQNSRYQIKQPGECGFRAVPHRSHPSSFLQPASYKSLILCSNSAAIPQSARSSAGDTMAFPVLSRRHATTPTPRSKRRPQPHNSTTSLKKVSSSSPHKCARSESLRSTWMTNSSDSMEEEQDPDLYQHTEDEVERQATRELQVFVQLQRPLSDWVYWQRDAVALPDCWTRVFAVFCGESLWLYRYEDASAKSLLVRMRVTALEDGDDARQLQFWDADTAASVQLYMPDAQAFYRWHSHVSTALAKFPPVKEEETATAINARQRTVVPAVASVVQKKKFWKALAIALVAGSKSSSYDQVAVQEHAVVVYDGGRGKSLGQRWQNVRTTLKTALKLGKRHHPQLELQQHEGSSSLCRQSALPPLQAKPRQQGSAVLLWEPGRAGAIPVHDHCRVAVRVTSHPAAEENAGDVFAEADAMCVAAIRLKLSSLTLAVMHYLNAGPSWLIAGGDCTVKPAELTGGSELAKMH